MSKTVEKENKKREKSAYEGEQSQKKPKKEKKVKEDKGFLAADIWFFGKVFKYCPMYIISSVLYGVMMGIWPALGLIYTERLYDAIGRDVMFEKVLLLIIAYYGIMFIIRAVHIRYQNLGKPKYREILYTCVYSEIFEHSKNNDLADYDNPEFFNDFVTSTQASFTHGYSLIESGDWFIRDIIAFFAGAGVIFTIDPIVSAIIFLSGIIRMFFCFRYNNVWYKMYKETLPYDRRANYTKRVFNIPDYAKDLRISNVSDCLVDSYDRTLDEVRDIHLKHNKKFFLYDILISLVLDVAQYGVMIFILYKLMVVNDGSMTLGGFAVCVNAVWGLSWRLTAIGLRLKDFHQHGIFLLKLRRFFDTKPTILDGEYEAEPLREIELKDMSFSYRKNEDERFSLKNVNMKIHKGEKIAIVGYNGAGKTTLTKLLMRLYDPTDGEILYNGKKLSEYTVSSLRGRVAAVFQDYKIFAATIAENVVGGEMPDENIEAVRHNVEDALRRSTFEGKLKKLPHGIDTMLTREFSDEGTNLSGGESQKVAIARAFYKDADLIILDEPSSALDPNAEYDLNCAISEYAADKTVIFISHRLSTTRHVDRIFMFENGEIVEQGSHDELIALGGKYAYMFNLQAEKYREEENEQHDVSIN